MVGAGLPARTTVQATLIDPSLLVEVDAVAAVPVPRAAPSARSGAAWGSWLGGRGELGGDAWVSAAVVAALGVGVAVAVAGRRGV